MEIIFQLILKTGLKRFPLNVWVCIRTNVMDNLIILVVLEYYTWPVEIISVEL